MADAASRADRSGANPLVTRKRVVVAALFAFLFLLPPVAELLGAPYQVSLFTRVIIFALAAVSLDLILGYGGMISFGHAAYFGVGGFTVGILYFHAFEGWPVISWPFAIPGTESMLVALPLAAVLGGFFALLIGAICLRTTGVYFIMITLAFAQMLYFLFVSMERYGGDDGLALFGRSRFPGLDLDDDVTFYYFCLAFLVVFVIIAHRLVNSRFGMVVRGSKSNERRMQALGFPTYRYKLACFVIAGSGAAVAGTLMVNQTTFLSPAMMHWVKSADLLIMVILGGMGTLFGPIIGAGVLLLLEETLASHTEHWKLVLGPILIVVVLFAHAGIYGLLAGRGGRDG